MKDPGSSEFCAHNVHESHYCGTCRKEHIDSLCLEIANLKMVCVRLARAKTLESRNKIAEKCRHLFVDENSILRKDSNG